MKKELTPADMLHECLPSGICVLILGPPGSGKTIFSQQLAYNALKRQESVIYITSKSQINLVMSQKKLFNWDITSALQNNQLGMVQIENISDPTELNIEVARTISHIRQPLSMVVVDSLTVLMVEMEQKKIMKFTENLARRLEDHDVRLLLLATPTTETEDFLTKMKSLVSSVIEITLKERGTIRRYMRIFKFLERRHSTKWYPFETTDDGIQFASSSVRTPDTFLFDLDGTLVTMELDFAAIREEVDTILKARKYPEELLDSTLSTLETINRAVTYMRTHNLDWEGLKQEAEAHLEKKEMEAASKAVCIEDARNVLEILKKMKKKVGIITRNNRKVTVQVLEKCGLAPYVDILLAREDVENVKPHPNHVLLAIQQLDSIPEKTVVLGDHHFEIEAGNKAGCFTVGVLTGSGTKETLKDADLILNSMKNLGEILTTAEQ